MSSVRQILTAIAVVALLAAAARLMAPFSAERARVLVPPDRYLDATLATLVVADGVEKLRSEPRRFYDTAILYPDHTQLRTTEPFLGFALLALPLRAVLRLDDADLFEMLRWTMLWVALLYAFLLFRAAGVDAALSAAGAAVCLCQPNLLNGIERLQILSIPLLFPVLYHGLMVWAAQRPRAGHSLGLFVWLALYLAEGPPLNPGGPVWWTRRSKPVPLNYHAMRAVLCRANASLGTNWSLHDFRHTAASRMLADPAFTLVDVQTILRHASISTTQIYTQPRLEDLVSKVIEHYARPPTPGPTIEPEYDAAAVRELLGLRS